MMAPATELTTQKGGPTPSPLPADGDDGAGDAVDEPAEPPVFFRDEHGAPRPDCADHLTDEGVNGADEPRHPLALGAMAL